MVGYSLAIVGIVWIALAAYTAMQFECVKLARCHADDLMAFGFVGVALLVPAYFAAALLSVLIWGDKGE
jgi:hypothetical protein